jgi:hypothetical protein
MALAWLAGSAFKDLKGARCVTDIIRSVIAVILSASVGVRVLPGMWLEFALRDLQRLKAI